MNKSAFLQLIQQAAFISDQQTEELEKVAATFPYCQTAHLLLAKSAYDKGSMLSTQRLRRASAYATNRQLLKRIIYTSPVAEPVFDEAAVEEQGIAASPLQQETPPAPLTAIPEEPEATPLDTEALTPAAPATEEAPKVIAYVEEPAEAAAPALHEPEPQQPEEPVKTVTENPAPETTAFEAETVEEEKESPAEEVMEEAPSENILELPMEKLDSELALLLTIKSLSPSFTDLLAQKPDAIAEAPAPPMAAEMPEQAAQAAEEATAEAETPAPDAQEETPQPATEQKQDEDALAKLISEEVAAAARAFYSLDDVQEEEALTEEAPSASRHEEPAQEQAAVEEAEVKYAFDEIDEMYQQDVLGYWMASSRMGEALQLKEEDGLTRPKPQSFHPELILEYSKTHELVPQDEPAAPSLHEQLNIIDQFLKINPRLKAMNNVKLKPEPQEDLSLKSSKINRGIASESLANIFLQQGKVKKAIKIYEQLILKYPEKKSYFAEQIEKLQNLS